MKNLITTDQLSPALPVSQFNNMMHPARQSMRPPLLTKKLTYHYAKSDWLL